MNNNTINTALKIIKPKSYIEDLNYHKLQEDNLKKISKTRELINQKLKKWSLTAKLIRVNSQLNHQLKVKQRRLMKMIAQRPNRYEGNHLTDADYQNWRSILIFHCPYLTAQLTRVYYVQKAHFLAIAEQRWSMNL